MSFRWRLPADVLARDGTIDFGVVNPRDLSIAFQDAVTAVLPERINFLRVSLTGMNPKRTAAILNAWTEEFVSTAAELKKRNLVELAKVLDAHFA